MPVRWSSTHEMLDAALKLRAPITSHCASQQLDLSMQSIQLTSDDWGDTLGPRALFRIFVKPSTVMQGAAYPTLSSVIPHYMRMLNKLHDKKRAEGTMPAIVDACGTAIFKLNKYHTSATNQVLSHSNVATILDPRMNLRAFDNMFPHSGDAHRKNRAKNQFHNVLSRYATRERELAAAALEEVDLDVGVAISDPDSDDDMYTATSQNVEEEYTRWVKEAGAGKNADILEYWKHKQYEYPVLGKMARDYLAIPATSAPSERVFSHGSDIITKKRNRLAPETLRYLLCLRSWGIRPEPEEVEEAAE